MPRRTHRSMHVAVLFFVADNLFRNRVEVYGSAGSDGDVGEVQGGTAAVCRLSVRLAAIGIVAGPYGMLEAVRRRPLIRNILEMLLLFGCEFDVIVFLRPGPYLPHVRKGLTPFAALQDDA